MALAGSDLANEPGLGEEQFYRSSGPRPASLFQSIDLESSNKYATTAARDITFNNGGQFGESSSEIEDLLDHHGDGLLRRHDSPAVSTDEANEPRKTQIY